MTEFLDTDALYHAVADIFAVTVLLDNRERDRELVEYVHATMTHNHIIRPRKILSRRQILDEFKSRRDMIKEKLAADTGDDYKLSLLGQIKDPDLQRKVLGSIFTISICDYELHDEESDFIRTALRLWKTSMPTPQELEAVT